MVLGYLLPIWKSSLPVSYAGDPAVSSWNSATQSTYRIKHWNRESFTASRSIFTHSAALDKYLNYGSWCKLWIHLRCPHRPL